MAQVCGSWLVTVAVALQVVAFLCQLYSLLNWEHAVQLGIMPDRLSGGDAIESVRARLQWGNAACDVLLYLPLSCMSLLLYNKKSLVGFALTFSVLFFGTYWPLSVAFKGSWPEDKAFILPSVLVFGMPSGLGLWVLLTSRNEYCFDSVEDKKKES